MARITLYYARISKSILDSAGQRLLSRFFCYGDLPRGTGESRSVAGGVGTATLFEGLARQVRRTVTDGPFTEAKELIAGYTLIQVKSREEALEWSRRFPNPLGEGAEAEIEVRQL